MINDKLREIAENDTDLMIELLEIFFSQDHESMVKMRAAVAAKDWLNLAKVAHKFQPSVIYAGLTEVGEQLRSLENYVEEKRDADTIVELFLSIETELAAARIDLRAGHLELIKLRDK